jgi:hypothetical protein
MLTCLPMQKVQWLTGIFYSSKKTATAFSCMKRMAFFSALCTQHDQESAKNTRLCPWRRQPVGITGKKKFADRALLCRWKQARACRHHKKIQRNTNQEGYVHVI